MAIRGTKATGRRSTVRWQIAGLAGVGVAINSIDRSMISIALPFMSEDLQISPLVQGLVLGWFFLAYAIFLLPAGFLVDKVGARFAYGIGGIVWGLATVATATVSGIAGLLGFRLLLGLGEAAQYPSCVKATNDWFPARERGTASSVWDIGARIGGIVTLPLGSAIIALAGWRMAFVVAGALALVWAIGWLIEYRTPQQHRRLNQAERDYIASGQRRIVETPGERVSWGSLFRRRATWGLVIGYFCFNYVAYFFITWFPTYLVQERGFDLLKLGIFGAIPAIVAVFSEFGSGVAQDRLIRQGRSVNAVRKGFMVSGLLISSVIALAVLAPNAAIALVLLSVSYGALLVGGPALHSFPAELAPSTRHIGSLAGIQNSAGNLAGFLGPIVTGAIVAISGSFVAPLLITGAIALLGAFTYLVIVPRIVARPSEAAVDAAPVVA